MRDDRDLDPAGTPGRSHARPAQAAGGPRRVRRGQGPVPGDRVGRDRVRGRQRDPDRPLLPERLRHGPGRLQRPGDRQPRPQGVRAQERLVPLRGQGWRRSRQPGARPSPQARRRRRRHRARGSGRRQVRRPRPRDGRDDPAGARGRQRRARHGTDGGARGVRRHPHTRSSTGRATAASTCPGTSSGPPRTSSRRVRPSGCSRRSTTSSATSSSARWTSGSTSTTASWAS